MGALGRLGVYWGVARYLVLPEQRFRHHPTSVVSRRIVVFGAGSWGTALSIVLAGKGHDVGLWARRAEAAGRMVAERHNPSYLPGAEIPESVEISSDAEALARGRDMWVFATPSHAVRSVATSVASIAAPEVRVVSLAKGIENGSLLTTTHVLDEALPVVPIEHIGVLYGPSHAEEVAEGKPTTVVAAAHSVDVAHEIQDAFMTERLRVYVNHDVTGVEIGGSVKNVLAIATGIAEGLGYGDNTKAAIVTRGLAEMRRLGMALGADATTFGGLAGVGDLVVTCMSKLSRNRHFGELIGRGMSYEEAAQTMTMVAEGARTTESVHELGHRHGIELPITEAVYKVLFEGMRPQAAVDDLMNRAAKRENWLPDVLQE